MHAKHFSPLLAARMTPVKFSIPHLKVCFGPAGQMIKLLPNRPQDGQPARVEIEDVDINLKDSKVAEELRLYPGPLVRWGLYNVLQTMSFNTKG